MQYKIDIKKWNITDKMEDIKKKEYQKKNIKNKILLEKNTWNKIAII